VGFNPFQQHDRDLVDIAMVVVTVLVVLGLVAWAVLSG
jgi:hypothetical protein